MPIHVVVVLPVPVGCYSVCWYCLVPVALVEVERPAGDLKIEVVEVLKNEPSWQASGRQWGCLYCLEWP